eukprot:m.211718 g.211718  ORF g.211718 m.211718 type:complete len:514 (-) comp33108_c0_seq1:223-1764(-)
MGDMNDDIDVYDDPDGAELPEPFRTIDNLITSIVNQAWDDAERRNATRKKLFPVDFADNVHNVEGTNDVRLFDGCTSSKKEGNFESLLTFTNTEGLVTFIDGNHQKRIDTAFTKLGLESIALDHDDCCALVTTVDASGSVEFHLHNAAGTSTSILLSALLPPKEQPLDDEVKDESDSELVAVDLANVPTDVIISARVFETCSGAHRLVVAKATTVLVYAMDMERLISRTKQGHAEPSTDEAELDTPIHLTASVDHPRNDQPVPGFPIDVVSTVRKHTASNAATQRNIHTETQSPSALYTFHTVGSRSIMSVAWEGDNQLVWLTLGRRRHKLSPPLAHSTSISALCANGANLLAVGLMSGTVVVWDVANKTQVLVCSVCTSPLGHLVFAGKQLIVAGVTGLPLRVDCVARTWERIALDRVSTVQGSVKLNDCGYDGTLGIAVQHDVVAIVGHKHKNVVYVVNPLSGIPLCVVALPTSWEALGPIRCFGEKFYFNSTKQGNTQLQYFKHNCKAES